MSWPRDCAAPIAGEYFPSTRWYTHLGLLLLVLVATKAQAITLVPPGFTAETFTTLPGDPHAYTIAFPPASSTAYPAFLYAGARHDAPATGQVYAIQADGSVALFGGVQDDFHLRFGTAAFGGLLYGADPSWGGSPGITPDGVYKLPPDGSQVSFNLLGGGNPDAGGMAFATGGAFGNDLYVANPSDGAGDPQCRRAIVRIDSTGTTVGQLLMHASGPLRMALSAGGPFGESAYFSVLDSGRIYRATVSGSVQDFADVPASFLGHGFTFGLGGAFGSDLYVSDITSRTIYRVDPSGVPARFASDVEAKDIAFDPVSGDMFIAEWTGGRILRIRSGCLATYTDQAPFAAVATTTMEATFESRSEGNVPSPLVEGRVSVSGQALYVARPGGPADLCCISPHQESVALTADGNEEFDLTFSGTVPTAVGLEVTTNRFHAPVVSVFDMQGVLLGSLVVPRGPNTRGFLGIVACAPIGRLHWVSAGGETEDTAIDDIRIGFATRDITTWTQLIPGGTLPGVRAGHSVICDEHSQRMLAFGGAGGPYQNNAWELPLSGGLTWTPIQASGTPPSAWSEHAAVYDSVRDRMIVFGGTDDEGVAHNEAWTFSLSGRATWLPLAPAGTPPSPRHQHSAIYDPVRDRMLVFGGRDGATRYNDVWALSLLGSPSWSQLSPSGTAPGGRHRHTAVYDPVRDRMVVFGGADGSYRNDVWALSLTDLSWTPLRPVGALPPARDGHTAVYDPVHDQMVVYGGYDGGAALGDSWALTLYDAPGWTRLESIGLPPVARTLHRSIYDPLSDRMIVFGGLDGGSSYLNDAWTLTWGTPATLASIRVTAEVRVEHDDGPFLYPPPPLPGLTVRLITPSWQSQPMVTDDDGTAVFPVEWSSVATPSAHYELQLAGPSYHVKAQWNDREVDPITRTVPISVTDPGTSYMWPLGSSDFDEAPALQAAYFVDRFRRELWRDDLGYAYRRDYASRSLGITVRQLPIPEGASPRSDLLAILFSKFHWSTNKVKCEESDVVYHEYTHCVLYDLFEQLKGIGNRRGLSKVADDEGHAMDEAVPDYFAASFTDDPVIDRRGHFVILDPTGFWWPRRDISTRARFRFPYREDRYSGSLILSGALWDLRSRVGAATADRLVYEAFCYMVNTHSASADFQFTDYLDALLAVQDEVGCSCSLTIRDVFAAHNISQTPMPLIPLAWQDDNAITTVNATNDHIQIAWRSLPGAVTYQVLVGSTYFDSGLSIGKFVPIATGLTDTTFVYEGRNARTEYLFSVVAVDSAGDAGYRASPAFIEAEDSTVAAVPESKQPLRQRGRLLFNTPNPFNSQTTIHFETMTDRDDVDVTIYDIAGRRVRQLRPPALGAGRHSLAWDGQDSSGRRMPSGKYFVLLHGSGWSGKVTILLVK